MAGAMMSSLITDLITCVSLYHYADDDRLMFTVVADIKVRVSVRIIVI